MMASSLNTYILEAYDDQLRRDYMTVLGDVYSQPKQIFDVMQQKDYYNVQSASHQRPGLERPFREIKSPGNPHLPASFPLRCFQRLSLPYIATLRCLWRDNRYTSGTSTPVLSY
ncbi:spore coat protein [bacterium BFN5]|nr:spore coat protein [bacterium BFN5]